MSDRLVYDLFDKDALWFINYTKKDKNLPKKLKTARDKIIKLYGDAEKAKEMRAAASRIHVKVYRYLQTLFVTEDAMRLRLAALSAMGYLYKDAVELFKPSTVTKQTWMRVSDPVAQCIILNYISVFTGSTDTPAVVNYMLEETWYTPLDILMENRRMVQVFLQQRGGEIFVTFPELERQLEHPDEFTKDTFFKSLLVFLSMECYIARLLDITVILTYMPAWTKIVKDTPEIDSGIDFKVNEWTGKQLFINERDIAKKAGSEAMLAASGIGEAVRVNRGLEKLFKISTLGKSTLNTDHKEVIAFFSDALRLLLSNESFPPNDIKDLLRRHRSKNEAFIYLQSRWSTTPTPTFDIHEELLQLVIVSFNMMVGGANQFNHFNTMMRLTMTHDAGYDKTSKRIRIIIAKRNHDGLQNVADLWRWLYSYSVPAGTDTTRRLWIDEERDAVVGQVTALQETTAAQAAVNVDNLGKHQTTVDALKIEKERVANLQSRLNENGDNAALAATRQLAVKDQEISTLQETINRLSDASSHLTEDLARCAVDVRARDANISRLESTLAKRDATFAGTERALEECTTKLKQKVDTVAPVLSTSQGSQTSAEDVARLENVQTEFSDLTSDHEKSLEEIIKLRQRNALLEQRIRDAAATCDTPADTRNVSDSSETIDQYNEDDVTLPVHTRADSQQYGYRYPPISVLPDEPSQPRLAPAPPRRSRIMETFARGNMPSISLAALADMDLAGLDPDERRILAASLRI